MITWLRAQLDTDERVARAAHVPGPGNWTDGFDRNEECTVGWLAGDRAMDHMEIHDPDRALRQVQAHRAILAAAFGHMAKVDGEWGCCHSADAIERGHCPEQDPADDEIIKALVSIYSNRDGYREEWRP